MLKIVIVGSGEMATSLLLGVKEAGHKVVGIFRQERVQLPTITRVFKDVFAPTDFYLLSKTYKITEIVAPSVNSEIFRKKVRELNADLIIVGSWGEKFSKKTILTPKLATINCHPALLPEYRGPNPYMATISCGETMTGITFHLMSEKYDAGEILWQSEVPILHSDTGYTLKLRCAQQARITLKQLLPLIENGSLNPIAQNEQLATYFPRITEKDIYIDFSMTANEIYNKVRGFTPWATCYLRTHNQFLKIGFAQVVDLTEPEFFVKNKKYITPKYVNIDAGKILAKGNDWLLCSTIENEHAILLGNLKLYGFLQQFLTKEFLKRLKKIN